MPDEEDLSSNGSRRLASLQRRAFEPELREAARKLLPRYLARVLSGTPHLRDELEAELLSGFEEPGEEHRGEKLLEGFVVEVAQSIRRMGLDPLDGVVVGTLHHRSIDAFSNHFFGTANIIGLHVPLMIFSHTTAKVMATFAVLHAPSPDHPPDPTTFPLCSLGLRWLTQHIHAIVVDNSPIGMPASMPPLDWPFWPIVVAWTGGIELFVVAHEYGHLVHAAYDPATLREAGLLDEGESLDEPLTAELAADRFAFGVLLDQKRGDPWGLLGPFVFLWFLDRLESDTGRRLRGENHPLPSARLSRGEAVLSTELYEAWSAMKSQLAVAWSIARRSALGPSST